jgi:hypothetical protein
MSLTVDFCNSSPRVLLQNAKKCAACEAVGGRIAKGRKWAKKSPQGFLRRLIYYAKTCGKSQMNEKIVEKQPLASRQFVAFCPISLDVAILQPHTAFV